MGKMKKASFLAILIIAIFTILYFSIKNNRDCLEGETTCTTTRDEIIEHKMEQLTPLAP